MSKPRNRGPSSTIFVRDGRIHFSYYDVDGTRRRQASGFVVGEENQARGLLDRIDAKVRAERLVSGAVGGTLAAYAEKWIERRLARIASAPNDDQHLRLYILPHLGRMPLGAIKRRHVVELLEQIRPDKSGLAPRTVRSIRRTLVLLFRDAILDEVIDANPAKELPEGALPPNEDKDPEWRNAAHFTRSELERLISDEQIRADRRIVYALKGLAGLRHSEVAAMRWEHYDASMKPLGKLLVANAYRRGRSSKGTKTGATRWVPVHSTLAAMLAEWRLGGWERLYRRAPKDDDLIVPSDALNPRAAKDAQDALERDLALLGMRVKASGRQNRRGHDLRATLITLAQEDGGAPHLLELGTHGATKSGNVFRDYYTRIRPLWPAICAEWAKLKVFRREAEVIELPLARAAGAGSCHALVTVPEIPSDDAPKKANPSVTMTEGLIAHVAVRHFS